MTTFMGFLDSSIGRKLLMALTGIFLCSFLIVHLMGNLLLFKSDGGAAFDQYSEFMSSNLIIRTIEIGLFAAMAAHAVFGFLLWRNNKRVRPTAYSVSGYAQTSASSSRLTFVTGSLVFIFLVVHLQTFFVPARFGDSGLSMYEAVRTAFANPYYSVFYLIAMALLGYHLRHGFQSAFQTFGIRGKRFQMLIDVIGVFFWCIIPAGFATMPLYFLFG